MQRISQPGAYKCWILTRWVSERQYRESSTYISVADKAVVKCDLLHFMTIIAIVVKWIAAIVINMAVLLFTYYCDYKIYYFYGLMYISWIFQTGFVILVHIKQWNIFPEIEKVVSLLP